MSELAPRDDLEPELSSRLAAGARLAAALGGGAVGLIGGPGGAVGGAAVGWALGESLPALFREVARRVGPRAGTRAAAAVVLINDDAQARQEQGQTVRDDGFFDAPAPDLQSAGDELLEAVLRQAAEAYEERKLPYLARLFSATAHDAGVPAADAQYLVQLAGRLTFRQYVALAVLADHDRHSQDLINATVNNTEGTRRTDPTVRLELSDLMSGQIVGVGDEYRVAPVNDPLTGLLPRETPGYGQLRLLPAGQGLYQLMGLEDIGASDRHAWLASLGGELDN